MYSILLVDDEPLILSGIKFLLDWGKNDCQIIDTARNGKDALNKIRSLKPNIVLCDINMPVMSGIDLLQIVSEELPSIVFVMLTNLQDFSLAQSALKFRAVDYVVKNQLEAEALENSLKEAKKEWNNRNRLVNISRIEDQEQVMNDLLWKKFLLNPTTSAKMMDMDESLPKGLVFDSYAALYIFLDYDNTLECQNHEELFRWEKELIEAMAQKHFTGFTLLEPDDAHDSLLLLCYSLTGDTSSYCRLVKQFYQKLSSSSSKITQLPIHLMATDCFHGTESLSECKSQISDLLDYYYNEEPDFIFAPDFTPPACRNLGLTGISSHLLEAVREKSCSRCNALLDKAASRIQSIHHKRSTAIWLCSELYTTVCEELKSSSSDSFPGSFFSQSDAILNQIERLRTRSQAGEWLNRLKAGINSLLKQMVSDRNSFVEAAMQYVEDHIREHISLSDAADYVSISPAYLSSCFSKSCGQSFIDYVNARKIDYACTLIQENKHLIYEISYQLGFNNAYYFTKIFKRHVGMTPMEYQNLWKKN